MDTKTTFQIPEDNYAAFETKISRLSKRSERLTGRSIVPTVLGYSFKDHPSLENTKYRVVEIYLNAAPVKVDGYTFLASIDHTLASAENDSSNIIRKVPNLDAEVPEYYRTAKPNCDHCHSERQRNNTFLLKHDDGSFKQVGSTCLKDFFGHDVSDLARGAEYLCEAVSFAEGAENIPGSVDRRWINTQEFLANSALMIRLFGFVSSKEEGVSTRLSAYVNMTDRTAQRIKVTQDDYDMADAAQEWAKSLEGDLNDYMHNVKVIAATAYIDDRSTGVAASIVRAYQNHLVQKEKEGEIVSQHFGAIGDKFSGMKSEVTYVTSFEGMYGTTFLYIFRNDDGNLLKWMASKSWRLNVGDKISLSGTIKGHTEYKNRKQTVVTRCKPEKVNG